MRHWLGSYRPQEAVQRTVALRPEDRTYKRRRWHVLVDLVHLHCRSSGVIVVEVGTRIGYTGAHLLRYCPQIERLYTVDLVRPDPRHDWITHLERAEFIHADSVEAAGRFTDGSVDLVFIDADHAEESVLRDLEAWVPRVRPGGVISGHDYGSHNHPGVQRAVDRFLSGHPHPVRVESNKVWWTLK